MWIQTVCAVIVNVFTSIELLRAHFRLLLLLLLTISVLLLHGYSR